MGPRIVSVQTNPDLSLLTVAGGRRWRRLNNHLPYRTGYRSRVRDLWDRHNAARSNATGSILVHECRRLAKVSGSQGCQMTWGEDVGPCCSPGFKGDVAGITAACQGLLWRRLAGHWGSWRFGNCQLNRFGQDGTIGFESVVLQVACWAHVHLPTWKRRHFLLLQPPALLLGSGVLEPDLHHLEWQAELCADRLALHGIRVSAGLVTGLQNGQL